MFAAMFSFSSFHQHHHHHHSLIVTTIFRLPRLHYACFNNCSSLITVIIINQLTIVIFFQLLITTSSMAYQSIRPHSSLSLFTFFRHLPLSGHHLLQVTPSSSSFFQLLFISSPSHTINFFRHSSIITPPITFNQLLPFFSSCPHCHWFHHCHHHVNNHQSLLPLLPIGIPVRLVTCSMPIGLIAFNNNAGYYQ